MIDNCDLITFLEFVKCPLCLCVCVCCIRLGGFAAVIYTDSLQTLIIVGGALALMFIGMVDTTLHYNTQMVKKWN